MVWRIGTHSCQPRPRHCSRPPRFLPCAHTAGAATAAPQQADVLTMPGTPQALRFCFQCSKIEPLSLFDGTKR
jgi:hypothetical protein